MAQHRLYTVSVASVYPHYLAKVKTKRRARSELDEIVRWLPGYTQIALESHLAEGMNFERFFTSAPQLHPDRVLVHGVICGVRIEEIEDPLMLEVRRLDMLVDELAKGKAMEKILHRTGS